MRKLARDALACFLAVGCVLPAAASQINPGYRSVPPKQAPAAKPLAGHKLVAMAAIARRPTGPVLQCVTYARDASGIHLSGNAHAWWENAAGRFARGQRPEAGAVLNFQASGGMRMGHVSVVRHVVSSREVLIDDANWAMPGQRKGMVRRGASVIDVSPGNDWTEVRVANGVGSWGRSYPTFGFIYPRADRGFEPERIELAAERPVATLAERPAPRGQAAQNSGWVWHNGMATPAGAGGFAAALRDAGRTPVAAPTGQRWVWAGGQALPAR